MALVEGVRDGASWVAKHAEDAFLIGGVVRDEALRQIPRLEDEVIVEVVGQPGHTKRQLYYLALATAFGLLRRYDLSFAKLFTDAPTQAIMVEYDAADNWVRATVRYNTGLASAAVAGTGFGSTISSIIGAVTAAINSSLLLPGAGDTSANIVTQIADQIQDYISTSGGGLQLYGEAVVYSGPKDSVVGGQFNFTNPILPGIPTSAQAPGVPRLPFAGRVILTTAPTVEQGGVTVPTPNPAPPGDNRSRGTFPVPGYQTQDPGVPVGTTGLGAPDVTRLLIPLVFAALTDPGSMNGVAFGAPTAGPGGR